MPDDHHWIDRAHAARIAAAQVSSETPGGDRVGLEVEYFPMFVTSDGHPAGRPDLTAVLNALDGIGTPIEVGGNPAIDLGPSGMLAFEPGAQIEHVGPPTDPAQALAVVSGVEEEIAVRLASAGMRAVSLGWDPWHDPEVVGQQLPGDRYRAMDRYFRRRGDLGPQMMRNTCALQINLDATPDRWRAACALSPILTATFATGPDAHLGSRRASIWQRLDPTRTGVPSPTADPASSLCDLALAADVLLVRRPPEAHPGHPGWAFGDWIDGGHPRYGAPTEADFVYHLTTLFPEVRPRRGVLELRGIDALPAPGRTAAIVLVTGALYDDRALGRVLDFMTPHFDHVDALWRRAAQLGLDDPMLGTLAEQIWAHALDGARRLDAFDTTALAAAVEYVEAYVAPRRAPARRLAELPPPAVLSWASTTAVTV